MELENLRVLNGQRRVSATRPRVEAGQNLGLRLPTVRWQKRLLRPPTQAGPSLRVGGRVLVD